MVRPADMDHTLRPEKSTDFVPFIGRDTAADAASAELLALDDLGDSALMRNATGGRNE